MRTGGGMSVTRLAPVRVIQEAEREPWGLEQVMDKISDMQKNWANTYEHRRAYAALCQRRDQLMKKRSRG